MEPSCEQAETLLHGLHVEPTAPTEATAHTQRTRVCSKVSVREQQQRVCTISAAHREDGGEGVDFVGVLAGLPHRVHHFETHAVPVPTHHRVQ